MNCYYCINLNFEEGGSGREWGQGDLSKLRSGRLEHHKDQLSACLLKRDAAAAASFGSRALQLTPAFFFSRLIKTKQAQSWLNICSGNNRRKRQIVRFVACLFRRATSFYKKLLIKIYIPHSISASVNLAHFHFGAEC